MRSSSAPIGSNPTSKPTGLAGALSAFVHLNRAISDRLVPSHLKQHTAFKLYRNLAELLMRRPDIKTVLDVGVGPKWKFPAAIKHEQKFRLIGVDIDLEALEQNTILDEFCVSDICKSLSFADNSVDLVTGQSVIEHLSDNAAFLKQCERVLKPIGKAIFVFSGRYAPFAILNRILPPNIKHWLLKHFRPEEHAEMGYVAFYDKLTYNGFRRASQSAGLQVDDWYPIYYSLGYFKFFVPFFIVGLLIDHIRYLIGHPDIASYYVIVLSKPAADSASAPSSKR